MKKITSIQNIPLQYIQSMIKIDPLSPSGLTWLPRTNPNFIFNDKPAGYKTYDKRYAYQTWVTSITYNNKSIKLKCSRIIFLLHNGYLTKGKCIDHEDNNPLNNNPNNLRESFYCENSQNRKLPKTNTSGHKGVHWCKKSKKWKSQISSNNKTLFLGYYINKNDAIKAVTEVRKKLHGNFGRIK